MGGQTIVHLYNGFLLKNKNKCTAKPAITYMSLNDIVL